MSSTARQVLVVALLLATVVGLFVAAEVGQRRLEDASRRIEVGAQRQQALADVSQLLRQAESSQRGYILVGNPDYLAPFRQTSANLDATLRRLDVAFGTAGTATRADIEQLKRLSDEKLTEMRTTVELFATRGRAAALEMIRTDVGVQTMIEIDDLVHRIEAQESREILDSTRTWRTNRWVSIGTTSAALIASAGLLLLLTRLTARQLRSKERETEQLTVRQTELEQLVQQRTEELSELSSHLQSLAEQEKTALSRELHDELGGLLVAARMDVSWLEDRLGAGDAEVQGYFRRVHEALQAGVDIKRRVIENLRPTLLDNLGLFPALRWLVSESCGRAGLKSTEHYPKKELAVSPQASIIVFRIVQEALTNVLKHARARSVEISVALRPPWLLIRVRDDGVGLPAERQRSPGSHGLAAMRQRARALGGQWQVHRPAEGGTEVEVRLPLERVLASGAEAPGTRREA
jgi:signal transduction histidine kinase